MISRIPLEYKVNFLEAIFDQSKQLKAPIHVFRAKSQALQFSQKSIKSYLVTFDPRTDAPFSSQDILFCEDSSCQRVLISLSRMIQNWNSNPNTPNEKKCQNIFTLIGSSYLSYVIPLSSFYILARQVVEW